jgi:hypothetical protein
MTTNELYTPANNKWEFHYTYYYYALPPHQSEFVSNMYVGPVAFPFARIEEQDGRKRKQRGEEKRWSERPFGSGKIYKLWEDLANVNQRFRPHFDTWVNFSRFCSKILARQDNPSCLKDIGEYL